MDTHSKKFKVRLGLFVAGGLAIFVIAIFIIGKQKNLFNPVFKLNTSFYNVGGLEVGGNVRFSGINVGTVDNIIIINDSTVWVDMLVKKDVKKFIKTDSRVAVSSEGLIGDKILVISQGSTDAEIVKDGQHLQSSEPVDMEKIMVGVKLTVDNIAVVSDQLAEIMVNINSGRGTLGRLIYDTVIAEDISKIMVNVKNSADGFNQNMNAAKENFLLKGYFNRKAEAAAEEQRLLDKKNKKAQKEIDKKNKK